MHVITQICVLFLWMHTVTFVTSQDCTREAFINSPKYDSNFDTTELESSYSLGKQVRVGCNVGFSGFFKLICLDNGWKTVGSKCQAKSCGHPGDAQFADFHLEKGDDFVFGSEVVYTCHKGYQMVSRINYRRCLSEGWDGVVPVCEAQQCPVIRVENNVQVIGDLEEGNYGNVIRFSCKIRNQILEGPSEIYCDENGQWSGTAPICKEVTCAPPEIENGNVLDGKPVYQEHDNLDFACDRKYKRSDGRPSKCTKQGTTSAWSPTPSCEPIKCQVNPLEGTRFDPPYKNLFLPGERVRVTCDKKYWVSTRQEVSAVSTCQENGEWTFRPICLEVTCSDRRQPNMDYWESVRWSTPTLGDTRRFSCRYGYKSAGGARSVKCTRDGWKPDPACQEITCQVQNFENADIDRSTSEDKYEYKYNEHVNYVCKPGYEGGFTLTCGNARWIGNHQCTRKQCEKLDISNADLIPYEKQSYNHGESVGYACRDNPNRRFTIICELGVWTGVQMCEECAKPEVPHGFAVKINSTLYYTCDDGFKLYSKGWWGEAKCNDGQWPTLQQCIGKNECGEVPSIPNEKEGKQQSNKGSVSGQSITVTCKDGYEARIPRLTCRGGKWDTNGIAYKDICQPIKRLCKPPPKIENAVVVTPYQKKYLSDSDVTYRCRNNYTMQGRDDTITCQDGQWEVKDIACTTYCKSPKAQWRIITNTFKYFNGTVIEYRCTTGEEAEGTATCVDGEWIETVKCEALSCAPPPADEWITVKDLPENEDPILPDRFLTFSCDAPGKKLNGSSRLICGTDGQWDKPFPTCEDIACKVGTLDSHLHVVDLPETKTVKSGNKIRFVCDEPYAVEGHEEIECLGHEQWSAEFPTCSERCKITDVAGPIRMERHVVGQQLRKGEKLTFYCLTRGHFLRGNAEVECLSNGQWSHPFPTCGEPSRCGRPPFIADADTTTSSKSGYDHGERVQYRCQHYYTREGEEDKTCNNGEWTGEMRCLKPCTVDRALMNSHNIAFAYTREDKLYSEHNDAITFKCKGRTRPSGVMEMRQHCNDGVMHLPTCR